MEAAHQGKGEEAGKAGPAPIPWPDQPDDERDEEETSATSTSSNKNAHKKKKKKHNKKKKKEEERTNKKKKKRNQGEEDRAGAASASLASSSSLSSSASSSFSSSSAAAVDRDVLASRRDGQDAGEHQEEEQEEEEEEEETEAPHGESEEHATAKKKKKKKTKEKTTNDDDDSKRKATTGEEAEELEADRGRRKSSAGGDGSGGSGSWIILGQLGSKPRKEEFGDDKEARKQYKAAKKEWGERKRNLIDSLTPDEVREYKKEKKELTEKERLERKRERQERRRLMKEKKKLYKKPKIGKLVTQETKSYELVCDMLLGIRVTVSKISARPLRGNTVKDSDFRRVNNLRFPSTGSTNGIIPTPAHSQRDFTFRDYAPVVFRRLREHFGIEADDYLISLTGDYILSELISPGQSGQFFYFSYDLRFMLKTVTKGEAKFLKAILPAYYNHIIQNPNTLIARFFGFHRVAPHRDRKHYFVVMGNIFAQNLELHYRFDLKGSTVGRVTSPEKIKNDPNVVMKDQDFDRLRKTIALGPEKRKLFIDQVEKDVDLLEELGIMDYSLLVGIHDRRRLQKGRSLSMVYLPKAVDDEQLATAKGFNADTETDSSESESDEERLEQHHVTVFTQDQGGIQSTDEEDQPTDYIYFIGIIDILQPFNLRKRAEHGLKSFRFDGNQISAVNPKLYAKRFRDYVFARVRQPDTPQTPREVVGLPPRLPEAGEHNDPEVEREEVDPGRRASEGQTSMSNTEARQDGAKPSKGKATEPTTDDVTPSQDEAHAGAAQKKPKKKKKKKPKDESLEAQSASMDQESSPRTGNAGLIPKQLKVEKKKQQKMAAKKQKKTLPGQHEDTAPIQQPHPADKGKSARAEVASAAAPIVS